MGWAQFSCLLCYIFPGLTGLIMARLMVPPTDLKHQLLLWPISLSLGFILYRILLSIEEWPEVRCYPDECITQVLYWCVLPLVLGTVLISPLWGGIKLASWITPAHPFSFGFLWSIPLYMAGALFVLALADWRQRLINRRDDRWFL